MTLGTLNLVSILNALIFSILGLALFAIGFWGVDKMTHYELWKEVVEKQNTALAIVVGAISLGICSIIAAAIHG